MPLHQVDINLIENNNALIDSIDLSALKLTDSDITDLIKLLKKNNHIKTIDFSQNSIGDLGAIALANYINERLAESLANKDRCSFDKFIFDKNPSIRDAGGIALINSAIPRLVLSRTSVTAETATAGKKARQIELDLRFNNIDNTLLKEVNAVIDKNVINYDEAAVKPNKNIVTDFFAKKPVEEHKTRENTPEATTPKSPASLSKRRNSKD